ncbi:LysR family transcriptional regulator [Lampropedia puyangensis]|nr:LysR family transcriptional regulator [Lampropedia puyangensis]
MQHLRFLQYVDAVARCGSFRGAAERLHVAASAVNRRIQDIEDELGVCLFERLPRGVRLTTEGELFVAYARRRQADLEGVLAQMQALKGLQRGTVKLAISQALAPSFLPRLMGQFQRSHPKVDFEVKVLDHALAIEALQGFEADVGMVFNPPVRHGLDVLAKMPARTCAVMAQGHPLAQRASVGLKECFAYPVVMPDASLAGRAILDRVVSATGLHPNVVLQANAFELMFGYLRHSQAIGFQTRVGDEAPPGLQWVPIQERRLHAGTVALLALPQRVLPACTAAFAQHVAHCMAEA